MITPEQLSLQRQLGGETAQMQKLFVVGHLLIGADISALHIRNYLMGLGGVCKMNIFNGPHIKTPDSYDPETYLRLGNKAPEDVNGSVMWDDSGTQMYVFPSRKNWCTVDIYTCKQFDTQAALNYTYEQLGFREDMVYSTSSYEGNSPWIPFTLPDGKVLNPETGFLPSLDHLITSEYSNTEEVLRAGQALEQLVAQSFSEGCETRVADSYTAKQVRLFQGLHGKFETATDFRFINDILSGVATDPAQYPFQTRYNRLARMEAEAAQLERGDKVLHIGTGWPGTAIGMYEQFGIPVTCIEKDPNFAQRSRDGLEKLGLLGRDKLWVACADGCDISTDGYKAIIVSAMVPNRDKGIIIDNMRRLATGSDDPILILRTPTDRTSSLFYQELDREIMEYKMLKKEGETNPVVGLDPLRSLVFKVKGMSRVISGVDDSPLVAAKARLLVA